jgi:ferredoxin
MTARTQSAVRSSHVLSVDWTRCTGQGVCAAALGERIDLDTWGYPTGVSTRGQAIPDSLVMAARLAVSSCPAVALRLTRVDRA